MQNYQNMSYRQFAYKFLVDERMTEPPDQWQVSYQKEGSKIGKEEGYLRTSHEKLNVTKLSFLFQLSQAYPNY